MSVRDLGVVLKKEREDRGLTQEELAEVVGVARSYISKIERGDVDSIGYLTLVRLADSLGQSREALERLLHDGPAVAKPPPPVYPEPTREVPIVADVSAGPGRGFIDGYEYVGLSATRGRLLRAARVTGDCMEPEIKPGDVVLYDANREPHDGNIVVAVLQDAASERGRGTIKRMYRLQGRIQLTPNVGEPLVLLPDQVRIEGVVVEVRRKVAG